MLDLQFPEHTEEKLESLKSYYNIWFDIVKWQKTYIIDTNTGTGYNLIGKKKKKILGSALLAIDLFRKDTQKTLKLFFFDINQKNCEILKKNILQYLSMKKINAKLEEDIIIHLCDWSSKLDDILILTDDGIKLFFLDPTAIKSLPWKKLLPLIQKGKSVFGYKESGIEILLNWAWHAVRRKLGKYYGYKSSKELKPNYSDKTAEKDLKHLNNFFGPLKWRKIADKYPNNIFKDKMVEKIESLRDELVIAYTLNFFKYFKYVRIHPVYARRLKKGKIVKEKGKVKYFLIFATNYRGAINIIDNKFKEFRDTRVFINLPENQTTIDDFLSIKTKYKNSEEINHLELSDKIKSLENELGTELFSINKQIITFLYEKKNYDYGCYDFNLFENFYIYKNHYSLKFLLENNIIDIRDKIAKSNFQGKYYYLCHPTLVDRGEYLFYGDKVFLVENEELKEL